MGLFAQEENNKEHVFIWLLSCNRNANTCRLLLQVWEEETAKQIFLNVLDMATLRTHHGVKSPIHKQYLGLCDK